MEGRSTTHVDGFKPNLSRNGGGLALAGLWLGGLGLPRLCQG